jgi:hypothetical protein
LTLDVTVSIELANFLKKTVASINLIGLILIVKRIRTRLIGLPSHYN